MCPAGSQGTHRGREFVESWFGFTAERMSQDRAHLGFRRTTVPGRPALQSGNQVIIEISDTEAGHDRTLLSLMAYQQRMLAASICSNVDQFVVAEATIATLRRFTNHR
jgi:hypothetical protein